MALSRALMVLNGAFRAVPENGTRFLILRPRNEAVNGRMSSIFEQSPLKIRATDQRLLVSATSLSWVALRARWFSQLRYQTSMLAKAVRLIQSPARPLDVAASARPYGSPTLFCAASRSPLTRLNAKQIVVAT